MEKENKQHAIVLELSGLMLKEAKTAMKILSDKFGASYLQSRSPSPHITLISGLTIFDTTPFWNDLCFDIACVGLEKEDINITTEGSTLKVTYSKPSIESNRSDVEASEYIHKGITRKSFDMGWKISAKYNLSAIKAEMKNGLLTVRIPIAKESLPKQVTIK